MTIHVKLFGQLRTIIGMETIAIDCANSDSPKLGEVLAKIADQHAEARDFLLKPDGTLAGGLLISIDDAAVEPDSELILNENSTITLLTAISGG